MAYEDWIGRYEDAHDTLRPDAAAGLVAALHTQRIAPDAGDPAPPLAHWLCFQAPTLRADIGADGHPRRGGFLPPVPQPRRMWAGGDLAWQRPLRIGVPLHRRSTIADVRRREGRSGTLVFVTVEHAIADDDGAVLNERQDLVYRDPPAPDAPAPESTPAPVGAWHETITPDPVLLFRYSALTGNTHRIHYDQPYATRAEGYPGLVVHGPLIATLLLHAAAARETGVLRRFAFRAVRPLFDTAPFIIAGDETAATGERALHAADAGGALCMSATATFA